MSDDYLRKTIFAVVEIVFSIFIWLDLNGKERQYIYFLISNSEHGIFKLGGGPIDDEHFNVRA